MEAENLRKQVDKLKLELKREKKRNFLKVFMTLSKIYELQKQIFPNYTYRELAIDVEMNEQSIYNIMLYRKATKYAKQMIREHKISPSKICRILNSRQKDEQDKIISKSIEKNYTYLELDTFLAKETTMEKNIEEVRKYKNNWNIGRDLLSYTHKFKICLPNVDKVPEAQKMQVLNALRKLIPSINSGIETLEMECKKINIIKQEEKLAVEIPIVKGLR